MSTPHMTDVQAASYDNADVAFALDLHNFPEFRKNLERIGATNIPRIDENPARPKFRLGHVYDYALALEFSKSMSKEQAGTVVGIFLSLMQGRAVGRFNDLSAEDREAIHYDGKRHEYVENNSVKAPIDHGWFADYPWLAFDPEILDRSEERAAKPILWVVPGDTGLARSANVSLIGPDVNVPAVCDGLTEMARKHYSSADMIPPVQSLVVVNVTALLSEVDRRLGMRLRARQLRGAE